MDIHTSIQSILTIITILTWGEFSGDIEAVVRSWAIRSARSAVSSMLGGNIQIFSEIQIYLGLAVIYV